MYNINLRTTKQHTIRSRRLIFILWTRECCQSVATLQYRIKRSALLLMRLLIHHDAAIGRRWYCGQEAHS